jgi:hypothetical protein
MTDGCVHLLHTSSWKFYQLAAGQWSAFVRATGTVRKRQAVRPFHHVFNHTCQVTLLRRWTDPLAFGLIGKTAQRNRLSSSELRINALLLLLQMRTTDERVQRDWQWPLSGVHFIMMVNSALPGEDGGGGLHALPLSLYLPSRAKLWCTLQLGGGTYTPLISTLPFSPLWGGNKRVSFKYLSCCIVESSLNDAS